MKLSILPEFHLNKTADDIENPFKPFYTGNNPKEAFIVNNCLYFISFGIPFFLFLVVMRYFGFTPFGNKSMFIVDGYANNLPILMNVISDLRNNSFHLFSISGGLNGESLTSLLFFLASPFTIFTLLFDQSTAISLLTLFCIIRISLSAPTMLFYLTHRRIGRLGSKYDSSLLIFAFGYALSSYALVQYNDFMFLDIFMLLPLLLLGLEKIMCHESGRLFVVILSLCLVSNFYLGLTVALFSIFYYFFFTPCNVEDTLSHFFVFCRHLILSVCISAFTVFPGVYGLISLKREQISAMIRPYFYNDFFTYFLSHFFYGDPSYFTTDFFGSNLYVGTLSLTLVFLHFFDRCTSLRKRISDFVFLVLLFLSISFSAINIFSHLGLQESSSFTNFGFLYLFIFLCYAFDSINHIRDNSIISVLLSFLIPIGIGLLSMNYADPLPNFQSINYTIDLLVLFAIISILHRLGSIKRKVFYLLISTITISEIFVNQFQYCAMISNSDVSVHQIVIPDEFNIYNGSLSNGRSEYSGDFTSNPLNLNHLFSRTSSNPLTLPKAIEDTTPFEDALAARKYIILNTDQKNNSYLTEQYIKVDSVQSYDIYENIFAFPTAYYVPNPDLSILSNEDSMQRVNSLAKYLGANSDIYEKLDLNVDAQTSNPESVYTEYLGHSLYGYSKTVDSPDAPINYQLLFLFKSPKSGPLYIYTDSLDYYDTVNTEEEYAYKVYMPLSTTYDKIMPFEGYLFHEEVLSKLHDKLLNQKCDIQYESSNSIHISTQTDTPSTIHTILPYRNNYQVLVDGKRMSYCDFEGTLSIPIEAGEHDILISYKLTTLYFGITISLISLALLLIYSIIRSQKDNLLLNGNATYLTSHMLPRLIKWCSDNYVYILAFIIPFSTFLAIMLGTGCAPFGSYSLFNDDGVQINLPSLHDAIYAAKEGIGLHTWYGGAGRSSWRNFSFVYRFLSFDTINYIIPLSVVFRISLSGVTLIFYLTHRLRGIKAIKRDIRLLIPALSYTLCSYMLCMINNYGWYNGLVLFPLILLGMDHLMINKKKRYYVFFLAYCILTQYYIAMFICFFLVIYFFTYEFNSVKNFIQNALRFAFCSLSMLALCFSTIYSTLSMFGSSTYASSTEIINSSGEGLSSQFPIATFFSSWDYYFRQQMFLPETFQISWNEGDVNLYFGVLTLLLIYLYLLNHKIRLIDKLRFLIPYGIFFFSFNQSTLNYIFNGLHLQNGVPNRYAFLLVLLTATVSYDSLVCLDQSSGIEIILSTIFVICSFVYGVFACNNSSLYMKSFVASIIFLVIYCILSIFIRYNTRFKKLCSSLLLVLFATELIINAYITVSSHTLSTLMMTYTQPAIDYLNENTNFRNSLERVSIRKPVCQNYAFTNRVKTNHIFAAGSISPYQQNYASYTGNSTGINVLTSVCSSTLMGDAMGHNKYIVLSDIGQSELAGDLNNYKYLARVKNNYIFENEYCLPFGYFLPQGILEEQQSSRSTSDVWQTISYSILPTEDMMIAPFPLYKKELALDNGSQSYYDAYMIDDETIKIKLHIVAPASGELYTEFSDFQYLGYHDEGDIIEYEFDGTDYHTIEFPDIMTMCIFDKNIFYQLYDALSEHPFNITDFTSDTVDGTITMPENGIINFAMPYDEHWEAFIDGEKVDTYAHADAFFALKADKGTHNIHLEYVDHPNKKPYYIYKVSWWIFIILCFISSFVSWKKKNKQITSSEFYSNLESDLTNSNTEN